MTPTIKSVFAEATAEVAIDLKLIQRIHAYERDFVNRNQDHIEFFGGKLIGVHPIRFRPTDRDTWFLDVLEIDELALEEKILALPTVDAEWRRVSDVMNLSFVWLLYAFHTAPKLSPAQKEAAMIDTLLIMQYKFFSSMMAHWFKYPADPALMEKTYAMLSRKFAIKNAENWGVLLRERAKDILSPRGIHHRTITTFLDDQAVKNMVTDIQSRLKSIVKNITDVFYEVRLSGDRISSEKLVMEIDGQVVLKDKTRKFSTHIRYLHDVMGDRASFVRQELVSVVTDAVHTASPRLLVEVLEWMSLNHRVKGQEEIETLVDETLVHAFELITTNRHLFGPRTGLAPLVEKLRALYMASRMSSPVLLKTKALSETIVSRAISSKNPSVIASLRTAVMLYLVLRSLTMDYYTH